ncbi:putative ATP-dependent helicase YprA [Luteitalea sp. TBR-22]|uniref:DEAD/DEAH box helicase n=1 Tax=Luteitalea sp. TBR-22 TaxID=2802971 RepID=UPI001AF2F2E0|nr:DEAD/DEAH box helicase [Luteitalea sp. TBR-22]BCS35163.1 putative ATP-dependent helicase YprA [Luteitalea sp. TBR-22]
MSGTLARLSGNKDQALQEALGHLAPDTRVAPTLPAESTPGTHVQVGGDKVVTAVRHIPAQPARYAPWPEGVAPALIEALAARGIDEPYTHQAEAMGHALAGRHVVVVTPTASGKTLCYNGAVLSTVLREPGARALYLFPTKALAQDQLAELQGLAQIVGAAAQRDIGVFTYDGDTPADARRAIRARANVVLSNPDMLHAGVLPHHPRWARLFENLRYIVVDELHAYRGVFGSHLANVLRRLQRICRHYGSNPTFICTSATIANPKALAEQLTEQPFELVSESGAPRGEKFFVLLNPPVVNQALGIRRSYLSEARRVALEFLRRNLQLIVFAQSRLATEILTTYLKDAFQGPPGATEAVRGYRGGYLPLRRREIERGLREGDVRAVVSTNALELGIDIGALDVCVMAGYPGTIASTWQRAGRAGRRSGRSAAVMVASSAPLDQFIVRHPTYFFDASPEHALINPENLHVLLNHVKCAAFELPFQDGERFGRTTVSTDEVLQVLGEEGFVHLADGQWNWTHESYPADAISLRAITSDNFVIVDITEGSRVIGETDYTSALSTLHEKAIYILEGALFQVEKLDIEGRKAYVRSVECDYYTDAITYTKVNVLEEAETSLGEITGGSPQSAVGSEQALAEGGSEGDPAAAGSPAAADASDALLPQPNRAGRSHGDVHVVSRVVGFKKIRFYTNENVGSGDLDLPEQQMHTTSYWLTVPRAVLLEMPWAPDDRRDGVAGLAHAMKSIAQLLLMCDQRDIGVSIDTGTGEAGVGGRPSAPATGDADAHVFLYDNYPGGIGFSAPLFRMHDALLAQAQQLIASCPCEVGCPSCVGPVGDIGPRAKRVALDLLARLQSPSAGPAADEVPF